MRSPFTDNLEEQLQGSDIPVDTGPVIDPFAPFPEEEHIHPDDPQFQAEVPLSRRNRMHWAREALNRVEGQSLSVGSDAADASFREALHAFQTKAGLPLTQTINAQTERRLLEADAVARLESLPLVQRAIQRTRLEILLFNARTRIEDWTHRAIVEKKEITSQYRHPLALFAFVLHQMAFRRKNRTTGQYSHPENYLKVGAHFCIMQDGRIVQLHPVSRMIWHAQGLSSLSVSVEFEGNFPNIRGRVWTPKGVTQDDPTFGKVIPTPAQVDSGRFLASYLQAVLGTNKIYAHRQSSASRENDPGPDIWYNVGEWAIANLGYAGDSTSSVVGTGKAIPAEWRNWGNRIELQQEMTDVAFESEDSGLSGPDDEEDWVGTVEHENIDVEKAVRLNAHFGQKLGWDSFRYQINDLVLPYSGYSNVSLGDEAFAVAVSGWQRQQGFSVRDCDGIIGPKTWDVMRALLVPDDTRQPDSPSAPLVVGELGVIRIDTSVAELRKSFPEYRFTQDDALWLARFVEGEAGGRDDRENHAVFWAMVNRFGMRRHLVSEWTSFGAFLRRYSTTLQPFVRTKAVADRVLRNNKINPVKHSVVRGVTYYPGTSTLLVQYERHIKLQEKKWEAFPQIVRDMVLRLMRGNIPNPGIGIATHFASTRVLLIDERKKNNITGNFSDSEWRQYTLDYAKRNNRIWIGDVPNLDQRRNAFFIQPGLKNVPPAAVRIESPASMQEVFQFEVDDGDDFILEGNDLFDPSEELWTPFEQESSDPHEVEYETPAILAETASAEIEYDPESLHHDHEGLWENEDHTAYDESESLYETPGVDDAPITEEFFGLTQILKSAASSAQKIYQGLQQRGQPMTPGPPPAQVVQPTPAAPSSPDTPFVSTSPSVTPGASTRNYAKIIELNQKFGRLLGWDDRIHDINDLLLPYSGQQHVSLGGEAFVDALIGWQKNHGLTGAAADGILGPDTWRRMEPLLPASQPTVPIPTSPAPISTPPVEGNVFEFNRWHAQQILACIDGGFVSVVAKFGARQQLESIVRGDQVIEVDPGTSLIRILPLMSHICQAARQAGGSNILIGSFIRKRTEGKACTGHCAGRCIDINVKGGDFGLPVATAMVVQILTSLVHHDARYKKGLGFGLPIQGDFFTDRSLKLFSSVSPSHIRNTEVRDLISKLGIVFPDNPNHLHIQCGWT